jgi:hypothetical protein
LDGFASYAATWLTETIAPHRRPRTEFHRRALDLHLTTAFGRLLLAAITREGVRTFR